MNAGSFASLKMTNATVNLSDLLCIPVTLSEAKGLSYLPVNIDLSFYST